MTSIDTDKAQAEIRRLREEAKRDVSEAEALEEFGRAKFRPKIAGVNDNCDPSVTKPIN